METGFKLGGTSMAKNIKSKKKKGEERDHRNFLKA
jgi:hypothetical protein